MRACLHVLDESEVEWPELQGAFHDPAAALLEHSLRPVVKGPKHYAREDLPQMLLLVIQADQEEVSLLSSVELVPLRCLASSAVGEAGREAQVLDCTPLLRLQVVPLPVVEVLADELQNGWPDGLVGRRFSHRPIHRHIVDEADQLLVAHRSEYTFAPLLQQLLEGPLDVVYARVGAEGRVRDRVRRGEPAHLRTDQLVHEAGLACSSLANESEVRPCEGRPFQQEA